MARGPKTLYNVCNRSHFLFLGNGKAKKGEGKRTERGNRNTNKIENESKLPARVRRIPIRAPIEEETEGDANPRTTENKKTK